MPSASACAPGKRTFGELHPDGRFGGFHTHSKEGKDPLHHRCVQVI